MEPTRLPSGLAAPASYLRRRLISCKRHRTNSTPSGSVRSFAGRAGCRTWKDFLANPRASNDGPTVLSPISRSRFTTRLKISVAEESDAGSESLHESAYYNVVTIAARS